MRFVKKTINTAILIIATSLLLACGGGGGNDAEGTVSPTQYSGSTSPAAINQSNARTFVDGVLGANDTVGVLRIASVDGSRDQYQASSNRQPSLSNTLRQLSWGMRLVDYRSAIVNQTAKGKVQRAAINIDEVEVCDGGNGRVVLQGELQDSGIGTLTVRFDNCLIESDRFNGSIQMDVKRFDFDLGLPVESDYTIRNLSITGVDGNFSMGGALSSVLNSLSNEVLTANIVLLDNVSGHAVKAENIIFDYWYLTVGVIPTYSISITGRLYDSQLGYVDIQTSTQLRFPDLASNFPSNGGPLIIQGGNGVSISVTPQSAAIVKLEVDLDGDSDVEVMGSIPWSILDQPAPTINTQPVANAGSDRTSLRNQPVTVSGDNSTDVDYDLISFRWSIVEKPAGSNTQLSYTDRLSTSLTPDLTGQYRLALIVSDGQADSLVDVVVINALNRAPTAIATGLKAIYLKDTAAFSGGSSSDPEGDSLQYSWQVTQSPSGSVFSLTGSDSPTVSFSTDTPGDYTVVLTVNDSLDSNVSSHSFRVYSQADFKCTTEQLYDPNAQGRFTLEVGDVFARSVYDYLPLCDGWLYRTDATGITLLNAMLGFNLTHWDLPAVPTELFLPADETSIVAVSSSVFQLDIASENIKTIPFANIGRILSEDSSGLLAVGSSSTGTGFGIFLLDFQALTATELLSNLTSLIDVAYDETANKLFISNSGVTRGEFSIDRYQYDSLNPSFSYDASSATFSGYFGRRGLTTSPDGNRLAYRTNGYILDIDAASLVANTESWLGDSKPVFSRDGQYMATILDGTIYILTVGTKSIVKTYPINCPNNTIPLVGGMKFSKGGNLLYVTGTCDLRRSIEVFWYSFRP